MYHNIVIINVATFASTTGIVIPLSLLLLLLLQLLLLTLSTSLSLVEKPKCTNLVCVLRFPLIVSTLPLLPLLLLLLPLLLPLLLLLITPLSSPSPGEGVQSNSRASRFPADSSNLSGEKVNGSAQMGFIAQVTLRRERFVWERGRRRPWAWREEGEEVARECGK